MPKKANYHILVIDDIPAIHQDFSKILAPQRIESYQRLNEMKEIITNTSSEKELLPPFELEFALQGEEGVALVRKSLHNQNPFAVAFVDVQMPPGEDGIETIAKIWGIDHEIQIVICTAYTKYSWEDLQKKFGDSDRLFILKKPFDNLEIVQLASSLCKKWNLNRQQKPNAPSYTQKSSANSNNTLERLNDAMNILSKLKPPKS